jgi:hypothetical protein
MDIERISGPDMVPRGFSPEPPQREQSPRTEAPPVNGSTGSAENTVGTTIDTYA